MNTPKKILIAPLDWGLGHATRCIPVIHEFLNQGCEVQIASSGSALILLKQEFPALKFHELTPYGAHYSKTFPIAISLIFQIPKFLKQIKNEHQQMEGIVRKENIDFVISDNRYGCWTKRVPSVFITHQLNILMPRALSWIGPFVNYYNHRQIKKFSYCWVPDGVQDRITGILSEANGIHVNYIGMLSRFEKMKLSEKKYDALILLSGPEPQRTLMEEVVVKFFSDSRLKAMLVRGLPGETTSKVNDIENVVQANHLNARELNQVIAESAIVISRSGYSTVMDLAKINARAIFVPTPGQTEQEYLASRLEEKKIAYCTGLNELDFNKAIELSLGYSGFTEEQKNDLLVKAIKELLV